MIERDPDDVAETEADSYLGALLLLGLVFVGLLLEAGRELLDDPRGLLLSHTGWGLPFLVLGVAMAFLATLTRGQNKMLVSGTLGLLLLAGAGGVASNAVGFDALVRLLCIAGVLFGWHAIIGPLRSFAGIVPDRSANVRAGVVAIWLVYTGYTLALESALYLGAAAIVALRVAPPMVDAWDRLRSWLGGIFGPPAPAADYAEFEFADPAPRFTPEQQEVMDKVVDFINQNYNTGKEEKWPNPRFLTVRDAPGYTTYVLEQPMIFTGKTLIQRLPDLATAALGIKEERLNIMPGGEYGGMLIQITKTDEERVASVAWYDEVIARAGRQLGRRLGQYEVVLGLNEFSEPIVADLSNLTNPNLLVAGRSGSGKSQMIHAILAQLVTRNAPSALQFVFIDPKGVTGAFYAKSGLPHLQDALIEEEAIMADGPALLKRVVAEMDRRQQILMDAGVGNVLEYNRLFPRSALPLFLLVIDEAQDLAESPNEQLKNAYAEYVGAIARKGRSNWVRLVIGVQRPSVKAVGDFRLNLTQRIVMRLDKNNSPLALDDPNDISATKLSGKGDAFYVLDDSRRRFNACYLPESGDERRPGLSLKDELAKSVERWGPRGEPVAHQARPSRDAVAAAAGRVAADHQHTCTDREWLVICGLRQAVASAADAYEYLAFSPDQLLPFVERAADGYGYSDKAFTADEIQRALGKFYPDKHGGVPKSRDWLFCRAMIEPSKHDPGLVGLYAINPSAAPGGSEEARKGPSIDDVVGRDRKEP